MRIFPIIVCFANRLNYSNNINSGKVIREHVIKEMKSYLCEVQKIVKEVAETVENEFRKIFELLYETWDNENFRRSSVDLRLFYLVLLEKLKA